MFDVTGIKGFFQADLESLLWCLSLAMASRELPAQYDLGQAMIPYSGDVSYTQYSSMTSMLVIFTFS